MTWIKRLYVLGDSISIQYGPYLEQALRGVMHYARKEGEEEALLDLDNPQGANGGDSGMVRAFLGAKERNGGIDADLLLLNCGLHDIKRDPHSGAIQVPLTQYGDNLRAIVDLVRRMGPRLIWVRTTPCDERVHNARQAAFHRFAADNTAYNTAADAIMDAAGVPRIDLHGFTTNLMQVGVSATTEIGRCDTAPALNEDPCGDALGLDLYCDHVHFHDAVRQQQAAYIAGWLAAAG